MTSMIRELQNHFGTPTVTSAELHAYNPKYMVAARGGALKPVSRGVWSLESKTAKPAKVKPEDTAKKAALIKERFDVLEMLADGVAEKNVRSLIVSGAAGVGKTFTLESKLTLAEKKGKLSSLEIVKGTVSPIGLFLRLWENRDAGQVLILDDTDEAFNNEETMNILKAALDTSKTRRITWGKASNFLKDNDIPNSFDYNGQIVFITNKDIDGIIAKGGKLAPHMEALLSRSVFLDLAIHDNKSIMLRIEQVLAESTMLADLNVSKAQAADILHWMNQNIDSLRHVSLRSVIQLAGFVKTSPNWTMLANTTMLKARY